MTKSEYKALLIKTSETGGFPAMGTDGRCLYKTDDGKKCVIGLLIPDEKYDEDFEGRSIIALMTNGLLTYQDIPIGISEPSLLALQSAHDDMKHNWNHAAFTKIVERILK